MSDHLTEREQTEMRQLIKRLQEIEVKSITSITSESPFQQTETIERLISKFGTESKVPESLKFPEIEVEGPTAEPVLTTRSVSSKPPPTTELPTIDLPKFDGNDFEEFLKRWHRWLRLSGLQAETDQSKCVG